MGFIVSFKTEQGWIQVDANSPKSACLCAGAIAKTAGNQNVVVQQVVLDNDDVLPVLKHFDWASQLTDDGDYID